MDKTQKGVVDVRADLGRHFAARGGPVGAEDAGGDHVCDGGDNGFSIFFEELRVYLAECIADRLSILALWLAGGMDEGVP